LIQKEIGSFEGEKRLIPCNLHSGVETVTALPLCLEVKEYRPSSGSSEPLLYDYMAKLGPEGPIFETAISERYAIVPESMPTAQELEDWIKQTPAHHATTGLMTSLANFIDVYCAHEPHLPLVRLSSESINWVLLTPDSVTCSEAPPPSSLYYDF
jgi:hypothetical protein